MSTKYLELKKNAEQLIKEISKLINKSDNYPYFYELKGQVAFESGDIVIAKESYKMAYDALPENPLISGDYAKTLAISNNKEELEKASKILAESLEKEPELADNWKKLAQIYSIV